MRSNKKGLDLKVLQDSFKEKQSMDRDVFRAMRMAKSHTKEEDGFEVEVHKEQKEGSDITESVEMLVGKNQNLPSDAEITQMKSDLIKEDQIQAVKEATAELQHMLEMTSQQMLNLQAMNEELNRERDELRYENVELKARPWWKVLLNSIGY